MNAAQPARPLIVGGGVADLDEVMATMDQAFDPTFGEAWTRSQCSGILTLPGVWLVLARSSPGPGAVATGFALSRVTVDEAELLLLAVTPQHRRSGIGAALLATVAGEAHRRGATRLHLEMRDGNPAAALYAGAGFAEVGRRRAYYRGRDGRTIDAVTLATPLCPH